jgi:hypothetical protein
MWDLWWTKWRWGRLFPRVLRFPQPIFIPPISPQSPSPIIRDWNNMPVVAAVAKVPPHEIKKKGYMHNKAPSNTVNMSSLSLIYVELCLVPFFLFVFYLVCEGIGTAATPGLLCQLRVMVKMFVEKQMECRLAGET